ncbi:hypothetical protein SEVIR_3G061122v4 [Setaria viridis]
MARQRSRLLFLGGGGGESFSYALELQHKKEHGFGVLHCAACQGHLEVCKYLVEELGGDPNITADAAEGLTPVMASAQSGDVSTVKYLLDHGGELMKSDEKGCTVLHHAAFTGSCNVTEFLLSKGIPVDIDFGHGTPLLHAAMVGQDKTEDFPNFIFSGVGNPLMGALAGADVNGKGTITSPLLIATEHGGYTNFIQLLLKAGADPNIPDDLGRLPIELAALNDCRDEVKMLFPLTLPIPDVPNWSVDGVISHAKLKNSKPLDERQSKRRKAILKSQVDMAFRRKEYDVASKAYDFLLDHAPDATLYSNRSLCKLLMGDGEGALSVIACYCQAAAHMLLKEYKQAHDAPLDAQNLDPGND